MTKQPQQDQDRPIEKGTQARPAKVPTQRWHGGEVQRASASASPGGEEAEAAASRAEGNAPFPLVEARKRDAAARAPASFGTKAGRPAPSQETAEDAAANRDIEEAKRQAAAEEHAATPTRRSPHGRL